MNLVLFFVIGLYSKFVIGKLNFNMFFYVLIILRVFFEVLRSFLVFGCKFREVVMDVGLLIGSY